ncbi:MAG TPA: zf-TFIIB domain-containing protein [Allosphingosinicella sp.]|nr:zf-TFIIB domain-containing protein [Allosphingosinicella sp.]
MTKGVMACPVDGTALVMSERQNIEIDYCPACRGVWLDRGELDKIIERSAPPETQQEAPPAQQPPQQQQPYPPQAPYPQQHGGPWAGQHGHHPYKKRRKSFLEELFD